jgi:transposase
MRQLTWTRASGAPAKWTFRNGLSGGLSASGCCWMLPGMTSLVDRVLPEELWRRIQPLLPPAPPRPRGGVPRRVPDRNCVAALIFMARTSTPWSLLPARELGCGSATTCWRRLDEWAKVGVFEQLQAVVLDELGAAGRIDLERVSVDSFSLRAVKKMTCAGTPSGSGTDDRAASHVGGARRRSR